MIKYHGTPIGGPHVHKAEFYTRRHAMVSFAHQDDLGVVAEFCQSFVLDNGAFSVWRSGAKFDVDGYIAWVEEWHRHPGCDWALIPDVIDGAEEENDALIAAWPGYLRACGVPVWHLHESLSRLRVLSYQWPRIALGSSGQFSTPGTASWTRRMREAMRELCDGGRPRCKIHGLRMLDPAIFHSYPFASADSTNAAQNGHRLRVRANLATTAEGCMGIANRIEGHNSAATWQDSPEQKFLLVATTEELEAMQR